MTSALTSLNVITNFGASCKAGFFGLKPWYQYLTLDGNCEVVNFNWLPESGRSDILLVGLAVLDDLLRVAGLVAIAFIIYGGVLYVTSQGSPDQTQKAQNAIQNSLIGLIISILAVSVVSFIGSKVGG